VSLGVKLGKSIRPVRAEDIGVCASRRKMNGETDDIGRGRRAHLECWNLLKDRGRVVSMV
jgi:hypothetical protein